MEKVAEGASTLKPPGSANGRKLQEVQIGTLKNIVTEFKYEAMELYWQILSS